MRKRLYVMVDMEETGDEEAVLHDMEIMTDLFLQELENFDGLVLHQIGVYDSLSALQKAD